MDSDASTGLRVETARLVQDGRRRGAERTLVALGDSITYGWGLPYELSYPALLNRRLGGDGVGSLGIPFFAQRSAMSEMSRPGGQICCSFPWA
jgi:hypothetical protein